MEKLFVFILMLILLSCKGQKSDPLALDDSTYTINKEKILQDANKTILEKYIEPFIDSINNAVDEPNLPKFLSDKQFDYKHRGIWVSPHNPISVRTQIINRVNNCKALLIIAKSGNDDYKRKPEIKDNLIPPFSDLSFYDLVSRRISILDCY